jgi:hypothetical protein
MRLVHRIALVVLVLASVLGVPAGGVRAAELVMFEDPACPWCRRWHAEIGPAYPRTVEGRTAPLRRFHIRDQARAGVLLQRPITVTPTFVLAEEGREVGRIGIPRRRLFLWPAREPSQVEGAIVRASAQRCPFRLRPPGRVADRPRDETSAAGERKAGLSLRTHRLKQTHTCEEPAVRRERVRWRGCASSGVETPLPRHGWQAGIRCG